MAVPRPSLWNSTTGRMRGAGLAPQDPEGRGPRVMTGDARRSAAGAAREGGKAFIMCVLGGPVHLQCHLGRRRLFAMEAGPAAGTTICGGMCPIEPETSRSPRSCKFGPWTTRIFFIKTLSALMLNYSFGDCITSISLKTFGFNPPRNAYHIPEPILNE